MGGRGTAVPSTMAPVPSVLGDDSSDSEGEDIVAGDASPPRDREANIARLRRPAAVVIVEVSEDKVEAQSTAGPFWSMTFQATAQRTEDTSSLKDMQSPLHLGESPFGSIIPGYAFTFFYF